MRVLVDSSIWIDYFKQGSRSEKLDYLLDENILVINDLILTELVPFLKLKKQQKIISLLNSIAKLKLNIKWDQIIDFQYRCLKHGINGIGIPDLIIFQNALKNNCKIYSLDNHFKMIQKVMNINVTFL